LSTDMRGVRQTTVDCPKKTPDRLEAATLASLDKPIGALKHSRKSTLPPGKNSVCPPGGGARPANPLLGLRKRRAPDHDKKPPKPDQPRRLRVEGPSPAIVSTSPSRGCTSSRDARPGSAPSVIKVEPPGQGRTGAATRACGPRAISPLFHAAPTPIKRSVTCNLKKRERTRKKASSQADRRIRCLRGEFCPRR